MLESEKINITVEQLFSPPIKVYKTIVSWSMCCEGSLACLVFNCKIQFLEKGNQPPINS